MYKVQRVGLQGNMCACDIPSWHGGRVEEVREVRKVGSGAVLKPSLAALLSLGQFCELDLVVGDVTV